MSLNELQNELTIYQTKLNSSKHATLSALDSMLEDVINKDEQLQPLNSDKSKEKMRKHLKSASQQHKNLHSSVSKIGKSIDKLEVEDCQLHQVLPFGRVNNTLENAIYLHLRLTENSEIGEVLRAEYLKNGVTKYDSDVNSKYKVEKHGESIETKVEHDLSQVYGDDIIKKLERVKTAIQNLEKNDDIQGLFTWVLEVDSKNWHLPKSDDKWQENSMAVELLLDFNRFIHCLKIIYTLRSIKNNGGNKHANSTLRVQNQNPTQNSPTNQPNHTIPSSNSNNAWMLQQARTVIGDLRTINANDDFLRKELVGSLAYLTKLDRWPLCEKFLSDDAVKRYKTAIVQKVVKLVGVIYKTPQNSYLSSAFNAGMCAVPKLVQTRKLMVQTGVKQYGVWTGSEDLQNVRKKEFFF